MNTYSIDSRPPGLVDHVKTATVALVCIEQPFRVETQEGSMVISPDTVDDWEEGYYLAYPSDGSKPYAIAPSFVRANYTPVAPEPDGVLLERGKRGYTWYGEAVGGTNFRGDPMPLWEDLPDEIRIAWKIVEARIEHPYVRLVANIQSALRHDRSSAELYEDARAKSELSHRYWKRARQVAEAIAQARGLRSDAGDVQLDEGDAR